MLSSVARAIRYLQDLAKKLILKKNYVKCDEKAFIYKPGNFVLTKTGCMNDSGHFQALTNKEQQFRITTDDVLAKSRKNCYHHPQAKYSLSSNGLQPFTEINFLAENIDEVQTRADITRWNKVLGF